MELTTLAPHLRLLAALLVGAAVGLAAAFAVLAVIRTVVRKAAGGQASERHVRRELAGRLAQRVGRPLRLLGPLLGGRVALGVADTARVPDTSSLLETALYLLLVVAVAWTVIGALRLVQDALQARFDLEAGDNLEARKVATRVGILRRIGEAAIVLVAVGACLLYFEGFRQIGAGLLASAGIAGIVVGFAAQKALGNLIAGFQIAVTQPIRVDDVVVVEGEWGRIEEITLTYVVVRIWDLRRLVLPISYFIEAPFQNWTRTSADVLGSVFLHVDYGVDFAALRAELTRVLEAHPLWDGQVNVLHVTESGERSVVVRALMSTANSSDGWELRCAVREALIGFLQTHHPDALPRLHTDLGSADRPLAPPVSTP